MELGKYIVHIIVIYSYTKMGYAGNMEPSYLIPTAVAESLNKVNN
jgi:hypothetical protein